MLRSMLLSAAAAAVLLPAVGNAALIAGDPYLIGGANNYVAGTSLASQYTTTTVPGFVTGVGGGSGTAQYSTTTGGLVSAGANADAVSSGKISYANPGTTTVTRSTARNLNTVPNSSVYYESFLVNLGTYAGTAPAAARSILFGFGNATTPTAAGTTASATGLFVGFAQDGSAGQNTTGGNLVIRYNSNSSNTIADQTVLDSTVVGSLQNIATYLVVAEIGVNASGVGSATDTVKYWLNPTDSTSDATLTATAAASGTFNGDILNDASPGSSFGRLNYISQGWGNSSNASAFFDEPRLSTDLPGLGLASVPEPTSLTLVAMGGASLIRRRRRV